MALIKNIYSRSFFEKFATVVAEVLADFNREKFMASIFIPEFEHMEWKQRMKHTTAVLHEFLPKEFPAAVGIIEKIIEKLRQKSSGEDALVYMFFPDYIETYGLDDFKTSVKALEFVTQFISCEFAVRPFIIKYGDLMMVEMQRWSRHPSHKVRRFASEGSRPRLPWAMAIPALKTNPSAVLPILENLKNDPSEYVRRSVANNLNDIAKDHPGVVLAIAGKWKGGTKETDAIVKHGSRTLLKQGHLDILKHFGLDHSNIAVADFEIVTPRIAVGSHLHFTFRLANQNKESRTVRIEYAIHYLKANGSLSKKMFKISERVLMPDQLLNIDRKQSFKPITTKRFYPGLHRVSIVVNGKEGEAKDFELL